VPIAVVEPAMAKHVVAILMDEGISSIHEAAGSSPYRISVRLENKEAAIEVLKKDSARLKYPITFL
jgi:hypothetical protein